MKFNIDMSADSAEVELGFSKAFVSADHFQRLDNREQMKALLKRSLIRAHVEVSTYCNRTCGFCPNAAGTRTNLFQTIADRYYFRVLEDLREIEYDELFGFHLYNEPLADRSILTRIAQAREYLPAANLAIHTNGDYLDREYLEELVSAGLNNLNISFYGPNHGEFIDSFIVGRMEAVAKKLGLTFKVTREVPGQRYIRTGGYQSVKVLLLASNYWTTGYNRGELVEAGPVLQRTSPCFSPFQDLTINWKGEILPCCNVYTDLDQHQQWVIGCLSDGRSIFDHYVDMVEWRKSLLRFNPKGSPCESCSRLEYPELATPANIKAMNELAKSLCPIPTI